MIPSFDDVHRCGGDGEIMFVLFWIFIVTMFALATISLVLVKK